MSADLSLASVDVTGVHELLARASAAFTHALHQLTEQAGRSHASARSAHAHARVPLHSCCPRAKNLPRRCDGAGKSGGGDHREVTGRRERSRAQESGRLGRGGLHGPPRRTPPNPVKQFRPFGFRDSHSGYSPAAHCLCIENQQGRTMHTITPTKLRPRSRPQEAQRSRRGSHFALEGIAREGSSLTQHPTPERGTAFAMRDRFACEAISSIAKQHPGAGWGSFDREGSSITQPSSGAM